MKILFYTEKRGCTVFSVNLTFSACQILSNVLQGALKEFLHPLRLLKSKTRLQFADVQYILFTSAVLRDPEAAILLGRLLLVFLCNSLGGHLVFKDVVQWASN